MEPNDSMEFTGSTVDEAIANGLEALNVGPNDVLVEVLEEPSRGVFGIGARPARVHLKLLRQAEPQQTEVATEDVGVLDEAEEVDDDEMPAGSAEGETDENDGEVAREVLIELLDHMDVRGRVEVWRAEADELSGGETPPWILNIEGPDANLLIGRKGETLAALQYITRLITSRHLQQRANIVVDADGYKSQRTDRLQQLANRMADEAVSSGKTVELEPMPANERRIVHMALRNREDVETQSAGEGDSRKVTIVPR